MQHQYQYTITQSDTDDFLRVVVSYTDDLGTAETVSSALSSQVGNVNDAPDAGSDQTGAITEDASTTTATGTVQRLTKIQTHSFVHSKFN